MITIYKNKKDIPQNKEYIELNDVFFNKNTVLVLDEHAEEIVEQIDGAKLDGKFKIKSKFNEVTLDVDCLSTGCKTVLNVFYFPEKVFCMKECGDNALEVLYALENGGVYSNYAVIPFDMPEVQVCSDTGIKKIKEYEKLKEWWSNEE